MKTESLKHYLDAEVAKRDTLDELSIERPDPLMVASKQTDERAILACALFAYGRADLIVKFLDSIDFSILYESEQEIRSYFADHYYRFQTPKDVADFFIILKHTENLIGHFLVGYTKDHNPIEGFNQLITQFEQTAHTQTRGLKFLWGTPTNLKSSNNQSPQKRWNMFLRWMARKDSLDLGLWADKVSKAELILPLDTHTFQVSKRLGLLKRNTYDLTSALQVTQKLREFDPTDPIKYDFALYRIGQEKQTLWSILEY